MASTDKAILTEGQLSTLMTRIKEAGQSGGGVQSDWDEMDSTSPAYIKNRIAYSTKYTINPEALTPVTPSSDGYTALSPYVYIGSNSSSVFAQSSLTGNDNPGLGEDSWVKNVFVDMMSRTSFPYTGISPYGNTWVIAEQGALKGLFNEVANDSAWDYYKYQFTDGVGAPLTKEGAFRKYTTSGTFAGETVVAGEFSNGSGYGNILVVLWRDMAFVTTRDWNDVQLPYTLTRVQGEIKTIDPSLLPEATSTVKGTIALSQVGDAVATGEYLSKTLNQQGLTEINLRSSGIVDYEVNTPNSPEYLKNRPFYTVPAGQSYTETGTCSGAYLALNSTIEQALAWDQDQQINYPYMTYSVGPEDFSYQSSGGYASHVYYFLPDADVISAIRSGGQATVTGTQRVINEMAGTDDEYPFSFTGTFTRYNDDVYYADSGSYIRLILVNLTQTSVSGQTLPSGWTLLAIWKDNNEMDVRRMFQKPMTISAQTTTEAVHQLDSKYIKLDPNVFEINAQGQITLKTNP